jgi:hypothetical protein
MSLCHNVICSLPGSMQFVYIISLTALVLKKKVFKLKILFWFSLRLLLGIFLILKINERHMIKYICMILRVMYQIFLLYFKKKWVFSTDFRKNTAISNFIKHFVKIRSVGTELFHADRRTDIGQMERRTEAQTDMTKLTFAVRNFVTAPKKNFCWRKEQRV